MNYIRIAGLALVLTAVVSCGGNRRKDNTMGQYIANTQSVGKVVELISSVSPSLRDDFKQGDAVTISYDRGADTTALDSVILFISGRRAGQMNGSWTYRTDENGPVGRIPFRVIAYQGKDSTVRVGEFAVRAAAEPEKYGYRVKNSYPHDRTAYTQGLYWHDGFLYESTGQTGQSTLRQVDLTTGEVRKKHDLDDKYFGEGTAYLNGRIYQLTWQHNKGFIYDAATFNPIGEFGYSGDGWGLTTDGEYLYMSDGSEKISVLDPADFRKIRTLEVYSNRGKETQINELEWIEGEIWANVYMTDLILRIAPRTGVVKGVIDLRRILPSADKDLSTDVLNGIAYDAKNKRIFVTGKNWSKLFEIEVVKQ